MVILIATDGSPVSLAAARAAIDVAAAMRSSQVHALFVRAGDDESVAETALAVIHEIGHARGIEVKTHVALGSPTHAVLECARAVHADLVAAGTRGRTGVSRALFGSTFQALLAETTLPMLVVRGDESY